MVDFVDSLAPRNLTQHLVALDEWVTAASSLRVPSVEIFRVRDLVNHIYLVSKLCRDTGIDLPPKEAFLEPMDRYIGLMVSDGLGAILKENRRMVLSIFESPNRREEIGPDLKDFDIPSPYRSNEQIKLDREIEEFSKCLSSMLERRDEVSIYQLQISSRMLEFLIKDCIIKHHFLSSEQRGRVVKLLSQASEAISLNPVLSEMVGAWKGTLQARLEKIMVIDKKILDAEIQAIYDSIEPISGSEW